MSYWPDHSLNLLKTSAWELYTEIELKVFTNPLTRVSSRLTQLFLLQHEAEIKPQNLPEAKYSPNENMKTNSYTVITTESL